MKNLTLVIIMFILGLVNTNAQNTQQPDSLGLPGDNLNLYAVMKLFQSSETLEGFERSLNAEDSKINNLDLNNDDKVDYIRVIDNVDKNIHNIVLQVPVNDKESQDVATFIVEKKSNDDVDIQLIGDEELYGKDYIIEPNYTDNTTKTETPNPGYVKQSTKTTVDSKGNTTIINNYTTKQTASWPVVSYMFMPAYVAWVSPWRWYYYPTYWTPWTPWYWHRYYGYHYNYGYYYYGNYRYCHVYRNPYYYNSYYSRRTTSVYINVNIKSGGYRKCYAHPESRSVGKRDFIRDSGKKRTGSNAVSKVNTKPVKSETKKTTVNKIDHSKPTVNQQIKNKSDNRVQPQTKYQQHNNERPKQIDRSAPRTNNNSVRGRKP